MSHTDLFSLCWDHKETIGNKVDSLIFIIVVLSHNKKYKKKKFCFLQNNYYLFSDMRKINRTYGFRPYPNKVQSLDLLVAFWLYSVYCHGCSLNVSVKNSINSRRVRVIITTHKLSRFTGTRNKRNTSNQKVVTMRNLYHVVLKTAYTNFFNKRADCFESKHCKNSYCSNFASIVECKAFSYINSKRYQCHVSQ